MKKQRKIKGHYTLVDTYSPTEHYTFESFQDYCSACDEDGRYNRESEDDWYEWAAYEMSEDFDHLMDNLVYTEWFHYPAVVEGTLGLWWGSPEVVQRLFGDVVLALRACIDRADDFIIKKAGHRLEVETLHHDGRNYFTITLLTPTGECRFREHGSVSTKNRENYVKLPEYLF